MFGISPQKLIAKKLYFKDAMVNLLTPPPPQPH